MVKKKTENRVQILLKMVRSGASLPSGENSGDLISVVSANRLLN